MAKSSAAVATPETTTRRELKDDSKPKRQPRYNVIL